jgi:pimeloyl-ACP methyl ester carboxylesterase
MEMALGVEMKHLLLLAAFALTAASPVATDVTVPGPEGPLAGTLLDPGAKGPAIVIIPGSGPTDRDGNNPMGVRAAPYRLLAEALAAQGIATLRADKRGMFASRPALANPNAVTIAAYAGDAHAWAKLAAERTGQPCAWLLGHSEGGLIALQAAQDPKGLCGIILVSAPGRKIGAVMREQFRANPANAPFLDAALGMLDSLEAGKPADPTTLPSPLDRIFPAAVQPFLIDMLAQDPAKLAAAVRIPILIVQGERDLQVSVADAQARAKAAPAARLVLLPEVNHVLKTVASDDRAANMATYGDPALPIAPGVVEAVAAFVRR